MDNKIDTLNNKNNARSRNLTLKTLILIKSVHN
jgi:hypothetical protein